MKYDKKSVQTRFHAHKRRYRKAGIDQDVTIEQMHELFAKHSGICDLCDEPMEFAEVNIDHKITISKGGIHTIDNMQLVHKSCNGIKRDKDNELAKWLCKSRDKYRHCPCCDCIKPLSMWYRDGDYEYSRCKQCNEQKSLEWKNENIERVKELNRIRYLIKKENERKLRQQPPLFH